MSRRLIFAVAAIAIALVPSLASADEPIPVERTPLFPVEQGPVVPMGRAVWVHVDASRPVTLERLAPQDTQWHPLCVAPCDSDVPLDGIYRVTDRGMIPSVNMELDASPGDHVVLDVSSRTYEQHTTGRRLTITGYIAGAVGLGLEIGALTTNNSDAQTALLWSGIGTAALAIACTISAWILLEPTNVSQSASSPATGKHSRAETPWTRLPTWRADESAQALPRATNVTVFTARF